MNCEHALKKGKGSRHECLGKEWRGKEQKGVKICYIYVSTFHKEFKQYVQHKRNSKLKMNRKSKEMQHRRIMRENMNYYISTN